MKCLILFRIAIVIISNCILTYATVQLIDEEGKIDAPFGFIESAYGYNNESTRSPSRSVVQRAMKGVCQVFVNSPTYAEIGTGFLVQTEPDPLVVTARHVIQRPDHPFSKDASTTEIAEWVYVTFDHFIADPNFTPIKGHKAIDVAPNPITYDPESDPLSDWIVIKLNKNDRDDWSQRVLTPRMGSYSQELLKKAFILHHGSSPTESIIPNAMWISYANVKEKELGLSINNQYFDVGKTSITWLSAFSPDERFYAFGGTSGAPFFDGTGRVVGMLTKGRKKEPFTAVLITAIDIPYSEKVGSPWLNTGEFKTSAVLTETKNVIKRVNTYGSKATTKYGSIPGLNSVAISNQINELHSGAFWITERSGDELILPLIPYVRHDAGTYTIKMDLMASTHCSDVNCGSKHCTSESALSICDSEKDRPGRVFNELFIVSVIDGNSTERKEIARIDGTQMTTAAGLDCSTELCYENTGIVSFSFNGVVLTNPHLASVIITTGNIERCGVNGCETLDKNLYNYSRKVALSLWDLCLERSGPMPRIPIPITPINASIPEYQFKLRGDYLKPTKQPPGGLYLICWGEDDKCTPTYNFGPDMVHVHNYAAPGPYDVRVTYNFWEELLDQTFYVPYCDKKAILVLVPDKYIFANQLLQARNDLFGTFTINWGDGATSSESRQFNLSTKLTGRHFYLLPGKYPVTATLSYYEGQKMIVDGATLKGFTVPHTFVQTMKRTAYVDCGTSYILKAK